MYNNIKIYTPVISTLSSIDLSATELATYLGRSHKQLKIRHEIYIKKLFFIFSENTFKLNNYLSIKYKKVSPV